ncbi:hypothetical protein FA15DRAFT_658872 [Coprinopsis marcescibilis]|uniref:Uncharacterized protein n=1 Tax=Coprinopsis marcescibilis TaxID=230819 RepID=A0A5C3KL60_COPMA|nr:hypothetical protein FA15DRAFT_658872 [Coprinopsis marcescibilis]
MGATSAPCAGSRKVWRGSALAVISVLQNILRGMMKWGVTTTARGKRKRGSLLHAAVAKKDTPTLKRVAVVFAIFSDGKIWQPDKGELPAPTDVYILPVPPGPDVAREAIKHAAAGEELKGGDITARYIFSQEKTAGTCHLCDLGPASRTSFDLFTTGVPVIIWSMVNLGAGPETVCNRVLSIGWVERQGVILVALRFEFLLASRSCAPRWMLVDVLLLLSKGISGHHDGMALGKNMHQGRWVS